MAPSTTPSLLLRRGGRRALASSSSQQQLLQQQQQQSRALAAFAPGAYEKGSNEFGPGGRSSVSGITAALFGGTGFMGKYLQFEMGEGVGQSTNLGLVGCVWRVCACMKKDESDHAPSTHPSFCPHPPLPFPLTNSTQNPPID